MTKALRLRFEAAERRHRMSRPGVPFFAGFGAAVAVAGTEGPAGGVKPETSPAMSESTTQPGDEESAFLKGMSLDDLMNVEVFSVSRRESNHHSEVGPNSIRRGPIVEIRRGVYGDGHIPVVNGRDLSL